jgi:alpha-beta hydrolase superfamily lysophospholipase
MKRLSIALLLLLCTACATPQEQPHNNALRPSKLTQYNLVTTDEITLPIRSWPPRGKPKAVIIALHGFNDYSRAFELPGKYMSQHGIAVYAYDQRGFGQACNIGIWPGEENLTHDVADMVRAARKRYPHVPLYVLGESMGGAVAIAALVRPDFPHIDGLILSAPALWGGETMNPFFRASLWALAHTWPQKILTGEDLRILASDNIAMLRALGSDPFVIKGTRVDTVYGLVRLMDTAYNNIGKVNVPMLILYGAHDQVIPPYPMIQALRRINARSTAAYYPLGYHMLLRDLHGDVPLRDIIVWIANKRRPLPSGADKAAKEFLAKGIAQASIPPKRFPVRRDQKGME